MLQTLALHLPSATAVIIAAPRGLRKTKRRCERERVATSNAAEKHTKKEWNKRKLRVLFPSLHERVSVREEEQGELRERRRVMA